MAISKLGSIKSTLSLAIDYILNPEKTENGKYTYSEGCSLDGKLAEDEFLNVRALGTGKGSVLAQHIKLSFLGKEASPENVLEFGKELAEKFLKGKYQYVLSVHTDTDNVHLHLIFNNIDYENYRSFEYQENRNKVSWKNLRKINDELCEKYNLSIIENPKPSKGKCYYEWQQDALGKSWKSKLRYAIDEAVMQSATFVSSGIKSASKSLDDVKATNRSIIEPLAQEYIQKSVDDKYGSGVLTINKVVINNADFDEDYNKAIADKQKAQLAKEQQDIVNEQNIAKAEAEKEAAKIKADGEAEAAKIKADGEAAANEKIEKSLTDNILRDKYLEKWNGELPQVVSDSNSLIYDISGNDKSKN